ncbi:MAG: hypothetical protein HY340_02810 [Candidatus Kerfeldbacteria bacterium]|nr:hypothetical protein [Candidatus Kerfeldbacteria bacterium]
MIFNRRHLTFLVFALIPLGKICLDCGIPMFVPLVAKAQNHMASARMSNCESMPTEGDKLTAAPWSAGSDCRLSESQTLSTTVAPVSQHADQKAIGTLTAVPSNQTEGGSTVEINETGPPLEVGDLLTGTIIKLE